MSHGYAPYQQQQQPYPSYDAYPMYDMNNNNINSYPVNTEKYARYNTTPQRSCCDRACCGCCTCCPRWCRWISCILFLLVIAIVIVIVVLGAMFKKPSVEFTGIQGTPSLTTSNGTVLNLGLDLGFSVNNPNIESVTFTSLEAQVYYHGFNNVTIGQGSLNDLHISSNAITNIQFPFTLSIDPSNKDDTAIATKLLSDCGIGGNQEKINLDYKLVATVKVVGISIHVPFSSSVDFDCPMSSTNQQQILSSIAKQILGHS
ncbi:hypothetical protein G6F57_002008 [Rhizopus arrhizus]|uniref:Late embryogenesis abundant protein LEA-2 subgroup domain-containing protein n=1 Tax=Rhizopus oryzae TaxID=64495 RepID=A0A9P7BTQ0_RHIOR|nr:hypothetical protein G6F23_002249 [Rhizopus arrhizus]KAG1427481.1 hypothetical protein G6F58_001013 [Rhizopus delemar]KAG0764260.1 hypothetical protein G6F24_005350 [Rhizopus arrhizus]KAG0797384.1 hypothetical protein G6F22_004701 [Rhizopus arrhizus]KAG0856109.1 hypothetical protein G6F17_004874 [Rhizopus arrhizus]